MGMDLRSEAWHICHCSGKDETSTTHVLGRWATAFGLTGFFMVLFGSLITRRGYLKSVDHSNMKHAGPVVMIIGACLSFVCLILIIILVFYLLYRRKQRRKNPLSEAFIDKGYPQVIELVDGGNITPTRTEDSDTQSLDIHWSDVESVDETTS